MKKAPHNQNAKTLRPQLGFTLLELMVTVAVAVILLAIAVPAFNDITRANKLSNDVNSIVQALFLARSYTNTTLCASVDHATCSTVTSDWATGWIITNAGGVVRGSDRPLTGTTITASGTAAVYDGRGHLPPGTTLTFTFCNGRTGVGAGRTVTVSSAGLPTTTNYNGCT